MIRMKIREIDARFGANVYSPERKTRLLRSKKIGKLITEAYGSFPGQFEAVEDIAENIVLKATDGDCEDKSGTKIIVVQKDVPGVGEVDVITRWKNAELGDTRVRGQKVNERTIELNICAGDIVYYNLSTTIAHELMHCFQTGLSRVRGINEKSALLYSHLLEFYHNAPSPYVESLFFGLYICYDIETNANVSSAANYIEGVFKGKDKTTVTTKDIQLAFRNFDKYRDYAFTGRFLKNTTLYDFSSDDISYVKKCLTGPVNGMNGEDTAIFDKEKFNAEDFIENNRKRIVMICEKTIDRMWKNAMLYFEEEKR